MDTPIEYMLTTKDNPYNPFTEFEAWHTYDMRMGYNTAAFLGRIAKIPEDLPEPYPSIALQEAIDEIVNQNVSGMWIKVSRDSFDNRPFIEGSRQSSDQETETQT